MDPGIALIRAQKGGMAKIAKALNFTRPAVLKWERVPAEYLPIVERVTNIPRHQLRPDIVPPPEQHAPEAA